MPLLLLHDTGILHAGGDLNGFVVVDEDELVRPVVVDICCCNVKPPAVDAQFAFVDEFLARVFLCGCHLF